MMQQIVKLSEEQMKFQAEIRTSMSNRYGYSDRGEGSTPRGPQGGKRPPADPPYSDSGGGMRRNTPLAASDTGQHQAGANWRYRKLDMPLFDGANPDGWILRAERYFDFYRLNEVECGSRSGVLGRRCPLLVPMGGPPEPHSHVGGDENPASERVSFNP